MSRSKKNWDWLVDEMGNYRPVLGQGQKGDPGQGLPGEKGEPGQKGDKLQFSELSQPDKDALKGQKGQKGEIGPQGDKGAKLSFDDLSLADKAALKGQKGGIGPKGEEGKGGSKGSAGFGINIIGNIADGTDPNGDPAYPCSTSGNALINDTTGSLWVCDGTGDWVQTPPLKGPKGEVGAVGPKGEVGDKGQKGVKGEDLLETLIKGNVLPPGTTPGELAEYLKGQKGEVGQKGEKLTFADLSTDDKKALKGQKGELGDKGQQGKGGVKGSEGELVLISSLPELP